MIVSLPRCVDCGCYGRECPCPFRLQRRHPLCRVPAEPLRRELSVLLASNQELAESVKKRRAEIEQWIAKCDLSGARCVIGCELIPELGLCTGCVDLEGLVRSAPGWLAVSLCVGADLPQLRARGRG